MPPSIRRNEDDHVTHVQETMKREADAYRADMEG